MRDKVRPARGFQRLTREKVRPTRPLQRHFREKVRPTRLKTAFFGHFGLAGRTFSRFRVDTAPQGELFRTQMKPPPRKPGLKGASGFTPATRCPEEASNAPVNTPLH